MARERAAGHRRRGLVHACEGRRVARTDPGPARPQPGSRENALTVPMYASSWIQAELFVGGGLGSETWHGPDRFEERDPGPEPPRRQRMRGPEVVGGRARPEDEQRIRKGHRRTIARQPAARAGTRMRPPARECRKRMRPPASRRARVIPEPARPPAPEPTREDLGSLAANASGLCPAAGRTRRP